MWPYSEHEEEWLSENFLFSLRPEDITHEMIQYYIRKSRRVRADYVALLGRRALALGRNTLEELRALRPDPLERPPQGPLIVR